MAAKVDFDWTQFTLKIEVKASPARVFKAWTDDSEISKWFVEKAIIEPRTGGRIYMQWLGGADADEKITAYRKNGMIQFPFGSKGEQVRVTVRKDGKHAICELRQFDMKTGPKDRIYMHMGCRCGWTFFLTNLKAYLEHGLDFRSHDPKRSYKQDFVNS